MLCYNHLVTVSLKFARLCKLQTSLNMHSMHQRRYLAYSEDALTLRLTSELVDLRVEYAKWS